MSARRGGNRIRGPQSALTDFLAANNISAAQIRDDYERRRVRADASEDAGEGPSAQDEEQATAATTPSVDVEVEQERTKKRKRSEKDAIEKIKKAKASKKPHKKAGGKKGKKGSDSDDDDGDYDDEDDEFAKDMYKKSRPAPGQFEHCELCSKRFTVTPYSKEGPEGGLLCTPCGKQFAKDVQKEKKAASKPVARKQRRKLESDRLDGLASLGAKSLQRLCIEKVAAHHEDVEELGDEMPQPVLERLSEIFSKKRVMKSRTLRLFLRPDLEAVVVHDAAYLEPEDYLQMFAVVPRMRRLVLGNACQFKDEAVKYMLERCTKLQHLHLYAANLVSNEMWEKLFVTLGEQLQVLKLKWLDAAFEDSTVQQLITSCPNLHRLKLKLCRRIGEASISAIADLPNLHHLSLQLTPDISNDNLRNLITRLGPKLQTLSLETFRDADDTVLATLHAHCRSLRKLRFSENDTASNAAYTALFTNWSNPPLHFADFSSDRDVDNNNPLGPEETIGLGPSAFKALMTHSGSALQSLNIASCRHITLQAFMDVFNGSNQYPELRYVNLSFCHRVDSSVVVGVFKSCPRLERLVAFGCFDVGEVVVPGGCVVIGVPRAQEAIEVFGLGGMGVEDAVGRMVEMGV